MNQVTIHELSQLHSLRREIAVYEQRLAELEAAATSTSTNMTGMPHGTGISNKTAIAADIADVRELYERAKVRAEKEYIRLMDYIYSVDDSHVRQLLIYRFAYDFSWTRVAACVGGITPDAARMTIKRFLSKN